MTACKYDWVNKLNVYVEKATIYMVIIMFCDVSIYITNEGISGKCQNKRINLIKQRIQVILQTPQL